MGKIIKRVVIGLIVVAIVGGIFIYKYYNSRTFYNEEAVNGNTAGNLYGNGLYCEYDGMVYFANPNDGDSLYVMNVDESDVTKLANDRIYYINSDAHYLYYSRNNNRDYSQMSFLNVNTNSLCRIDHDGSDIMILDDDICDVCALSKNTVYYLHYDTTDATTLYRVGIDGVTREQYQTSAVDPSCVIGEKLYYSGVVSDHSIRAINLTNNANSLVFYDNTWMPQVVNGYLYFMDLDDGERIYRVSLSGGEKEKISQYGTSDYNVDVAGNYIYYQSMKADTDGLYRIDLSSGEETLIQSGQFNSINVTSRYVYYIDYFSRGTYHTDVSTLQTSIFSPATQKLEEE